MQGPAIFWHWWQNSVRELVNDLDVMGKKKQHTRGWPTSQEQELPKAQCCRQQAAYSEMLEIIKVKYSHAFLYVPWMGFVLDEVYRMHRCGLFSSTAHVSVLNQPFLYLTEAKTVLTSGQKLQTKAVLAAKQQKRALNACQGIFKYQS